MIPAEYADWPEVDITDESAALAAAYSGDELNRRLLALARSHWQKGEVPTVIVDDDYYVYCRTARMLASLLLLSPPDLALMYAQGVLADVVALVRQTP